MWSVRRCSGVHAVSQRGAVISIYGAIYTLAGILGAMVMGQRGSSGRRCRSTVLDGLHHHAVIMIASGLLGLLLLWPNTSARA